MFESATNLLHRFKSNNHILNMHPCQSIKKLILKLMLISKIINTHLEKVGSQVTPEGTILRPSGPINPMTTRRCGCWRQGSKKITLHNHIPNKIPLSQIWVKCTTRGAKIQVTMIQEVTQRISHLMRITWKMVKSNSFRRKQV